jgi:hypothetical protein
MKKCTYIPHINVAGGFKNGGRFPFDQAMMVQRGFGHRGDVVVTISTATIEHILFV